MSPEAGRMIAALGARTYDALTATGVKPSAARSMALSCADHQRLNLNSYIDAHFEKLTESNNCLGLWTDNHSVFIDVAHIAKTEQEAVEIAIANDQLAIYDIEHGESRYIKDYRRQKNGAYIYQREESRATQTRTERGSRTAWHLKERRSEESRVAFHAYNPDEARDETGKWTSGGASPSKFRSSGLRRRQVGRSSI